jgi:hypothetical protein
MAAEDRAAAEAAVADAERFQRDLATVRTSSESAQRDAAKAEQRAEEMLREMQSTNEQVTTALQRAANLMTSFAPLTRFFGHTCLVCERAISRRRWRSGLRV